MGFPTEEQLRDRPVRHPGGSGDIRPGETPSQWIARIINQGDPGAR